MAAYDVSIQIEQLTGHVDLAIITALAEELEPVLSLIGGRERWRPFELEGYIHYSAQFACGKQHLTVVASSLWRYGGNSTIAQVMRLKSLQPRLIVMTGICAGWQARDIQLGDVIVADRAFHAGEGKQGTTGFVPDTRTYQPPPWLLQWLKDFSHHQEWSITIATPRPRSLRYQREWLLCQLFERGASFPVTDADWIAIQQYCPDHIGVRKSLQKEKLLSRAGKLTVQARKALEALRQQHYGQLVPTPDRDHPLVHYNAFASTEAVMAIEDVFREPARHVRSVGAIDLEIASLFAAATEIGIPAFAVKGVSDYGTPTKDDAFHAYAAEAAARWMYAFICNYAALLDQHLPKNRTDISGSVSASHPDQQIVQQGAAFAPALHQLRAPITDFVGRKQEIDQLIHALAGPISNGIAAISGVHGMGGVGKTELAYIVANHIASAFPDAQLVVNLHSTSDNPLTPAQALQMIIHGFDLKEQLSEDVDQLQNRYRSLLTGRRVLILADDARDAAQVRPLMPPIGCALLVTSRNRFNLPGITTLHLGTLSPQEAENLLLAICPRIGGHAPKLAELCGYLPLALRVSASLLNTDDTQDIDRYLEQLELERLKHLSDPADSEMSVMVSLRLSYKALDPATQSVLCQLSVFPVSFDRRAAQAVVSIEGDVVEALGILRRHSLLEWNNHLERYNLHDLVRIFASDQMSTAERNLARQRYSAYYLALAEQAEPELTRSQQASWLELLDREHEHLQVALRQMLDSKESEASLLLAGALWHFWEERGYLHKGRRWLDEALGQSEEMHLTTPTLLASRAKALRGAGWLATQQGDFEAAGLRQQESLKLFQTLGDRKGIAAVRNNLGAMAFHQSDYAQARSDYMESLDLYRELDDRHGIATTLGSLGVVEDVQGHHSVAVSLYEQSLSRFRELGEQRSLAIYLANLGNALYALGESTRATMCLEESLTLRQALGDRRGIASAHDNLGWFVLAGKDDRQAAIHFAESLRGFYQLGDREGIAWGLEGHASVAVAQQRFTKAARLFGAAGALRELIKAPRPPAEQADLAQTLETLCFQLGEDAFVLAWSAGQALSMEQSIAEALDPAP